MEIKSLIKTKISQYLSKEISKEDVYSWALDVMYKMLEGGILEIGNIEAWGIITGITEINDIDDVYCDEVIHRFDRILSGNENGLFNFIIKIPEKFVINNLSQTKNILIRYSTEKQLSRSDILALESITSKNFNIPSTLNEILENQIIELLNLGYTFYPNEERICFDLKHTVFVDEYTFVELDYLKKIIRLLECYDGTKEFSVHITFNNGVGNVSLQT